MHNTLLFNSLHKLNFNLLLMWITQMSRLCFENKGVFRKAYLEQSRKNLNLIIMHKTYIFLICMLFALSANSQITWTELDNAQMNGSILERPSGSADATASSLEVLPAGRDGYIEFVVSNDTYKWIFGGRLGISNKKTHHSNDEIDYAIDATPVLSTVDVYEEGVLISSPTITSVSTNVGTSTYRFERIGDQLTITRIYSGNSSFIRTQTVKTGDLVADVLIGGNGQKQIESANVFLYPVPVPQMGDQDWLEVNTQQQPQNISDAIYTDNRIGINFQNTVEAMLYVNIPGGAWTPGWNTILDADIGEGCRDNLLLQMGNNCDWSTAMAINNGTNRTVTVYANGAAVVNGAWYWSDRKFKTNIKSISKPLDLIKNTRGTTYSMQVTPDSEPIESYGYIAQELQKVLPKAVKDFDGTLAVNYTYLIPILTEGIKDQQEQLDNKDREIEALKNDLEALSMSIDNIQENLEKINELDCVQQRLSSINSSQTSMEIPVYLQTAWMKQNKPNPHFGITTIDYFIPSTAKKAEIQIFNLEGKLVSQQNLDIQMQKVQFENLEIQEGMYLYTLIIDDVIIDTKSMILNR